MRLRLTGAIEQELKTGLEAMVLIAKDRLKKLKGDELHSNKL